MTYLIWPFAALISGAAFGATLIGFRDHNNWLMIGGFVVFMATLRLEIWSQVKEATDKLRAEFENHLG